MREFVINENDAGQRVDKFIRKSCPNMPQSLMYRLIRQKKIKVNRKRCEPKQILQEKDIVLMFISDDFFVDKTFDFKDVKDLTNIVYEDENLLIIDKKPGVIVHSSEHDKKDTLIERVLKYLIQSGQYDPQKESSFIPAFANRLDKNTGGLIIACKRASSLRDVNEMIRLHHLEKHYVCIIEGMLEDKRYEHYYKKDEKQNKAFIYDYPKEKSVKVLLETKTLAQGKRYSLVDVNLITGKSHQIRAQLAHLKHPLIGDVKYGGKKIMQYQALYAYKLDFGSFFNGLTVTASDNFVIRKFNELEGIEVIIE